jgi:hypothetical protein
VDNRHTTSPPGDTRSDPPAPSRTDEGREQTRQVVDEVDQRGHEVAATVSEEAARVRDDAVAHARDLAEDAKQQLHRQAQEQTQHVGEALDQLGTRVHALADGRPEDAGPVGDYADRIADQVDHLARRVGDLGFDGVVDELQDLARRRPGAFLAAAAAAGFAAARLTRGAQDAEQEAAGPGERDRAVDAPTGPPPTSTTPTGQPPVVTPPPAPASPPPATAPVTGTTPPTTEPLTRPEPATRPDLDRGQVRR